VLIGGHCVDAISLFGTGSVTISGGGAQNAPDKVVQHNGRGLVTIKNFTVSGASKLYRSCGNCPNNGGPRNVVITGVKATGVKEVAAINSNVSILTSRWYDGHMSSD
jgi:hypothetical protein